jgi:hypothetical protein
MSNPLLEAALEYAAKDWRVFPIKPGGKKPLTAHGLKDATTDEAAIREWWKRWPAANIGYATGDGVVVLDVDDLGALTDLQEDANAPALNTSRTETSEGRYQLFFRTDAAIRNSAGKLRPGLDVRGDGGYVVLPPSVHPDGHVYRWDRNGTPDEIPAWLLELLVSPPKPPLVLPSREDYGPGDDTPYGLKALEAEAAIVAGAQEGYRRDRLNTAALRLGQLIGGGMLDEQHVRAELTDAARLTGLSEHEIEVTIKNAIEDGKAQPRTAPEQVSRRRDEPPAPVPSEMSEPDKSPDRRSRLVATPLSEIAMRSIEWLEKPLWQRSAFQLLSGPKGAGKGTYLASLAARVSRSGLNVVFISTEDSAEIDLKPRLVAAGYDESRCSVIRMHVKLPDDVDELRLLAREIGGVGLYVIDPVANHIGSTRPNDDVEVRHAIAPLNKLADDLDCLLIGVRHPGKDRSRGALASILGSTAWVDTPRAVVMIAADDEDPAVRHIQVVAGNRSLNGTGEAFRIDAVDVPGLKEPITLAVPLGASSKDVDHLLAGEKATRVSGEELQALILRELATGEKSREYLNAVASDELGASADSVYQTGLNPLRKAGQAQPRKTGFDDGWVWRSTDFAEDQKP